MLKYISTTKGWVKKMPGRHLAWMRRDPGNTSRQSPPSSLRNRKNKYSSALNQFKTLRSRKRCDTFTQCCGSGSRSVGSVRYCVLGLLDTAPRSVNRRHSSGSDPPDIKQNSKKNRDSNCFVTSLTFYLRKMMQMYLQKVITEKHGKIFFCWSLEGQGRK
jgi:hypothetical protein